MGAGMKIQQRHGKDVYCLPYETSNSAPEVATYWRKGLELLTRYHSVYVRVCVSKLQYINSRNLVALLAPLR